MSEDALYRSSSQFTTWTFTPSQLAQTRHDTNVAGKKAVLRRWKKARQEAGEQEGPPVSDPECLTVEEEHTLVQFYCGKVIELSDHFGFPSNVKATAVIFLERFHIHHSPMLHHPKHHLPTILFLATKTENHYIPLSDFCKRIPKSTPDAILKHEFLVAGGVGWDLDIRHPLRAVEGGIMELLSLINSSPTPTTDPSASWTIALNTTSPIAASDRVKEAHRRLRAILTTSALLSDSYFHYTPPQIFLGALYTADAPLAKFFIDSKFSTSSNPNVPPIGPKLHIIAQQCSALLLKAEEAYNNKIPLDEVKRIDKKLHKCQNPQKHLGGGNGNGGTGAGKGNGVDAEIERREAKRLNEREKMEQDDPFGGGGKTIDGGGGSGLFGGMLPGSQANT